jgi:hypothetical protein
VDPSFSGTAHVSAAGSEFDTLLGVYAGSSVSALTPLAASDDAHRGSGQSERASRPPSARPT